MTETLSRDSGDIGSSLVSTGQHQIEGELFLVLGQCSIYDTGSMNRSSLSDIFIPNPDWVLFHQLIYLRNIYKQIFQLNIWSYGPAPEDGRLVWLLSTYLPGLCAHSSPCRPHLPWRSSESLHLCLLLGHCIVSFSLPGTFGCSSPQLSHLPFSKSLSLDTLQIPLWTVVLYFHKKVSSVLVWYFLGFPLYVIISLLFSKYLGVRDWFYSSTATIVP